MSRRRVVVAGTAGGVGTTTVTALLFGSATTAGTAPRLVDHSGGDLGARLTGGDDAASVDRSLTLHDLGPHAAHALLDELDDPEVLAVVVAPTTPTGVADVRHVLGAVRARHSTGGLRRALVVLVGVHGQHRTTRDVEELEVAFGRRSVVVVPRDAALAAGGRVPLARISRDTAKANGLLASYLRERLTSHGGTLP